MRSNKVFQANERSACCGMEIHTLVPASAANSRQVSNVDARFGLDLQKLFLIRLSDLISA